MARIPDITDEETAVVKTTLMERYGEDRDIQVVDIEIRQNSSDREMSVCPAIYWEHDDCHFIIAKTADSQYSTQFFYHGDEQYGSGTQAYDDLTECVVFLQQTLADLEKETALLSEQP